MCYIPSVTESDIFFYGQLKNCDHLILCVVPFIIMLFQNFPSVKCEKHLSHTVQKRIYEQHLWVYKITVGQLHISLYLIRTYTYVHSNDMVDSNCQYAKALLIPARGIQWKTTNFVCVHVFYLLCQSIYLFTTKRAARSEHQLKSCRPVLLPSSRSDK